MTIGRPKKKPEDKTKMIGVRIMISLCEKLLPHCGNSYSRMIHRALELLECEIDNGIKQKE